MRGNAANERELTKIFSFFLWRKFLLLFFLFWINRVNTIYFLCFLSNFQRWMWAFVCRRIEFRFLILCKDRLIQRLYWRQTFRVHLKIDDIWLPVIKRSECFLLIEMPFIFQILNFVGLTYLRYTIQKLKKITLKKN